MVMTGGLYKYSGPGVLYLWVYNVLIVCTSNRSNLEKIKMKVQIERTFLENQFMRGIPSLLEQRVHRQLMTRVSTDVADATCES